MRLRRCCADLVLCEGIFVGGIMGCGKKGKCWARVPQRICSSMS